MSSPTTTPHDDSEVQGLISQALALHQQGQPEQAMPLYQRALARAPGHPQVHYLMGLTMQQIGQADAALSHFDAALRAAPDHAEASLQRGLLHYAAGRFDAALEDFRRQTIIVPQDPRGWINLTAALLQQNRLDEAGVAAARSAQLAPQHPDPWNNLANVHMRCGDFAAAEAAFRRALQFAPENGSLWRSWADALRSAGRLIEAESAYRRALQLDPALVNAWINYGNLLTQFNRRKEARAAFERALELDPNAPEALVNLSGLLVECGEERAAIDRLQPLVDAGHAGAEHLAVLAYALRAADRVDEAEQLLLRDAAHPDGSNASVQALAQLALAREALLPQAIVAAKRWLAERAPSAPPNQRTAVHILLAQMLDKAGDTGQAFAQAAAGKALKGERSDRAADQALAAALEYAFTRTRLRQPPYGLDNETRPVFIVGLPRSGTSLLEQMLAAHPQIYAAGEVEELDSITYELAGGPIAHLWPARAAALDAASLQALAQRYLHMLPPAAQQAQRIIDKLPYNFVRLGFIHLLFPQARIIHIQRDPRDVALSIFLQEFAGSHPYANHIEDIAHHILFHRRCMQHWRVTLPEGALFELHYEDMVDDPELYAHAVLDFLGLSWHPGVLTPEATRRTVLTSSRFQVQEPIHRRAAGRWQRYARELAPLTAILAPILTDGAA